MAQRDIRRGGGGRTTQDIRDVRRGFDMDDYNNKRAEQIAKSAARAGAIAAAGAESRPPEPPPAETPENRLSKLAVAAQFNPDRFAHFVEA